MIRRSSFNLSEDLESASSSDDEVSSEISLQRYPGSAVIHSGPLPADQDMSDLQFCEFASCEPLDLNERVVATPRQCLQYSQEEEPQLRPVISEDPSTLSQSSASPIDVHGVREQSIRLFAAPRLLVELPCVSTPQESSLKRRMDDLDSESDEEGSWVPGGHMKLLRHIGDIDRGGDVMRAHPSSSPQRRVVSTANNGGQVLSVVPSTASTTITNTTIANSKYGTFTSEDTEWTGYRLRSGKGLTPNPSPAAWMAGVGTGAVCLQPFTLQCPVQIGSYECSEFDSEEEEEAIKELPPQPSNVLPSPQVAHPELTVHEPKPQRTCTSSSDLSSETTIPTIKPSDVFSVTLTEGIEGEVVISFKTREVSLFYDDYLQFWSHDRKSPRSLSNHIRASSLPTIKAICPSYRRDRKFTPGMLQSALSRPSTISTNAASPQRRPSVFDPAPDFAPSYNPLLVWYLLGQLGLASPTSLPPPLSPQFSTPFGSPIIDPSVVSEQVPVVIACSTTPMKPNSPQLQDVHSPLRVKVMLTQGSVLSPRSQSEQQRNSAPHPPVVPCDKLDSQHSYCSSFRQAVNSASHRHNPFTTQEQQPAHEIRAPTHPPLPLLQNSVDNLQKSLSSTSDSQLVTSQLEEASLLAIPHINSTQLPSALLFNIPENSSQKYSSSKRCLSNQESYVESAKRLKFDI